MNRGGDALIRDRSPAAPFSDAIGWPPFLMRKGPYTPPHSPGDSPERTPVGTLDFNPSPIHPSIHLNPPYSNSKLISIVLLWGRLLHSGPSAMVVKSPADPSCPSQVTLFTIEV